MATWKEAVVVSPVPKADANEWRFPYTYLIAVAALTLSVTVRLFFCFQLHLYQRRDRYGETDQQSEDGPDVELPSSSNG